MRLLVTVLICATAASAADRVATPYDAIRGVLQQLAPAELKSADARAFNAWSREKDLAIRARLEQGDLDSMVNLLLFGTAFTAQPRMTIENLGAESRAGLLRARLDDLLKGLAKPGDNERLVFLRTLLNNKGYTGGAAGPFILDNLQRVLKEKVAIAQRIEAAADSSNVFSNRGVSLDTTILPNYGIDAALRELQARGLLRAGQVTRAAIVGPGLDFIDKESGFDYYPQQTLQPFAVHDSLKRLGLMGAGPRITILDISPRVLEHVQAARARSAKGQAYTIQLPRNSAAGWTPSALEYWGTFGAGLAESVAAVATPANLKDVETRAVRFPASVVLALDSSDLNIVGQRLELKAADKFDLVVATNILVYYDPFEQALALANIAAMLKPGGFLLTNDQLPDVPSVPMRAVGHTTVVYSEKPRIEDAVFWYQRQ